MTEEIIRAYLSCPACKGTALEVIPFSKRGDRLIDAVVRCRSCSEWYRLEDGLLEMLVPALRDRPAAAAFRSRFASRWPGGTAPEERTVPSPGHGDDHKLEQKSFYDQDAVSYETNMLAQPFWKAFDKTYTEKVPSLPSRQAALLEIGGGTGRMSLPIRARFKTILSFDLSESMVRTALRDRDRLPDADHVFYFVADAENIPVRSGSMDSASLSGILHHLESPHLALLEMVRALKPAGQFMGNENNRSFFRFLFDWMMSLKKLWNEKAHEEHFIISHQEIFRWLGNLGVPAQIWTSVFLPPHLFNLFPPSAACFLMRATDTLAQTIPWYRFQGGLVLYSGRKPDAAVAP